MITEVLRRSRFSKRERSLIYDALRELWNNTNVHHVNIRKQIETLMDEFNDGEYDA